MGFLEDSPEQVQAEIDGNTDVVGDESLVIPLSGNRVEPIEENDQAEEDAGDICEIRLEGRLHRQRIAVNALSKAGVVEADVGNADANPREQGGDGGQVLEPEEIR